MPCLRKSWKRQERMGRLLEQHLLESTQLFEGQTNYGLKCIVFLVRIGTSADTVYLQKQYISSKSY
jgi:hypothetical protein